MALRCVQRSWGLWARQGTAGRTPAGQGDVVAGGGREGAVGWSCAPLAVAGLLGASAGPRAGRRAAPAVWGQAGERARDGGGVCRRVKHGEALSGGSSQGSTLQPWPNDVSPKSNIVVAERARVCVFVGDAAGVPPAMETG